MSLTIYGGNVPDKQNDTPEEFAINVFNYQIWINNSFTPEFNTDLAGINTNLATMLDYKNTTFGYMNTTEEYKNTSLLYRNEAETFKNLAAATTNYKGVWSAGTYAQGESVKHNGYIWISDIDLNDSEPGVANWTAVSRAIYKKTIHADSTAVNGDEIKAYADTADLTITLTAQSEDDIIVVDVRDLTNVISVVSDGGESIRYNADNIDTTWVLDREGIYEFVLDDQNVWRLR